MKKLASVLLLIFIFTSACAYSEIDLSGMTYSELVDLKDKINLAIWQSADWQQVTVPQGIYKVGEDIPAGHWTISAAEGARAYIYCGTEMDNTYVDGEYLSALELISPSSVYYEKNQSRLSIDVELEEGWLIQIDIGAVVFTPYSGKPDLGFQ